MKKLFLSCFLGFLANSFASGSVNPRKPLILTESKHQIISVVLKKNCSEAFDSAIYGAFGTYYSFIGSLPDGYPAGFYDAAYDIADSQLNHNLANAFDSYLKCNSSL